MADDVARSHYATIPHIIDDSDLSVYAFRLYCHIRRVAGDTGSCWQSTRTLADICRMSIGQVGKARNELISHHLVTQSMRPIRGGHVIELTPVDIWEKNRSQYEQLEEKCSPHEQLAGESVHTVNTNDESVHVVNAGVHTVNERRYIEEEVPIDSTRTITKPRKSAPRKRGGSSRPRDIVFETVATVCGIDWSVCTEAQRHQLNQTTATLRRSAEKQQVDESGTLDRIRHTERYWYRVDWRGKQQQPPTPAQLREVWGAAMKTYHARAPASVAPVEPEPTPADVAAYLRSKRNGSTPTPE